MYIVERRKSGIVVMGPHGMEVLIPPNAVGVVLRQNVVDDMDEAPQPYAVEARHMTDAELVAYVLEIYAYPR